MQPGGHDELLREEEEQGGQADVTTIAAAVAAMRPLRGQAVDSDRRRPPRLVALFPRLKIY